MSVVVVVVVITGGAETREVLINRLKDDCNSSSVNTPSRSGSGLEAMDTMVWFKYTIIYEC
jgi:hypothetical protein